MQNFFAYVRGDINTEWGVEQDDVSLPYFLLISLCRFTRVFILCFYLFGSMAAVGRWGGFLFRVLNFKCRNDKQAAYKVGTAAETPRSPLVCRDFNVRSSTTIIHTYIYIYIYIYIYVCVCMFVYIYIYIYIYMIHIYNHKIIKNILTIVFTYFV